MTMFIFKSLLCYLYVNSINGLTLYQINNRLSYIEDRINAESKFRRDDFGSLYSEISSIKEMLQQVLESNNDGKETKHTDEVKEHTSKELEEKIHRLSIGFKEEKVTNSRIRRKTHELQRQFTDLRTITDKTSQVLADIWKGIEHLTRKTELYQNDSYRLQSAFAKIEICSNNFTEQYENNQNVQEQKLDKIVAGTKSILENTEQLNEAQKSCFDNIEHINNTNKRLEEETDSIENFVGMAASCLDLYNNGVKSSGIYQIYTNKQDKPLSVYCDMDTDDGGWTVFQRRKDGSVDFFRDWEEYKTGFGDLNSEFWLGNHYLNLLTDDKQHELRIDLEDFDGNRAYAKYSSFKILPEEMKYKLEVGGYTGNAGDSLGAPKNDAYLHDGMKFSTKDNDNDNSSAHCASQYKGAWWFNTCFASHLNVDWEEYKTGFGDLNGEFWLGNHYLNLLTDDDKQHELRIDLEDFDGNRAYAKYSSFKILPEEMKYKLEVGGYNGNAGDSLVDPKYKSQINNQMSFSTRDNDNDNYSVSCAHSYPGAWWFNICFASHLNGLYSQKATCTPEWKCIIWDSWKGSKTSIKFTEMKLR